MLKIIRLAKGLGVVIVVPAILLLSAESVSSASGGVKVIVQSGKGASTSSSSSSNGNVGDCSKLRLVVVAASISNPNAVTDQVTVQARCSTTAPPPGVVADAIADLGTGFASETQPVNSPNNPTVTGTPSCFVDKADLPGSSWTATCVFLFL